MAMRREPEFGYLLVALIGFLVSGPVIAARFGDADGLLLLLCLNATLILGIFSFLDSRKIFIAGIVLATVSLVITVVNFFYSNPQLQFASLTVMLIFLGMSIVLATAHLISPGEMSFNRLMGGACTYLMLGIAWAIFYSFTILYNAEAFVGALNDTDRTEFWDMMYFSFVTMTTMGYGDITPVAPMARVLAYLQAVTGQLYIAILVGALVGSLVSHRYASIEK